MFRHVADLYPQAPVYTSLYDARATGDLVAAGRVRTSALQLPGAGRYFRYLAPLYPAIFERFDLSAYDLIVSTTTAWAKGVRFRPDAVHVCYIHTVSRFAFDYERYVGGFGVMGWVPVAEYRDASPDPLTEAAPGILEHMNADHAESLVMLARHFGGIEAREAQMTAVDRLGFAVRLKTAEGMRGARIHFLHEVRTAAGVREVLVAMVKQARQG